MTERMAQLALSQKAAKVLKKAIEGEDDAILVAIVQDLDDQIEVKPAKKKKVKK